MPSLFQMFRLRPDSPDYHPGAAVFFRRYYFTGKRRRAYLLHQRIGIAEVVVGIVAYLSMQASHSKTIGWHISVAVLGLMVLIAVVHGVTMLMRRETFWQLRLQEIQASQQAVNDSKQELLDYAAEMQRRSTR